MTTLEERVASMPSSQFVRPAAGFALALITLLCGAAAAAAKTVPVQVRVLSTGGNVLADQLQYTGPTSVPTSHGADCFGAGTGGSGKPAKVTGITALGLLGDARRTDKDLRPLSISDHFDFGLALCGVGGHVAKGSKSWYLKVNHRDPQLGGDSVKVARGDEVLWYLAPSYPYPDELELLAPARTQQGVPFAVRVFAFDDGGKRSPARGVKLPGADLPTGSDGRTTVQLDRSTVLTARKGEAIPDAARICVGASCPSKPALVIGGSSGRDVIAGTGGSDTVLASGGADRVNVRGGGADTVDCGAGQDVVVLDPSDSARRCETRRGTA
jgi:Ca2+-binding RTX toxin-like protein